jgi:flagellin-like protein
LPAVERRLRANALGLSEIVGSLMLVLIVVTAATAFSIFIANYQKQIQAEQSQAHQKALESLKVITVATTLNGSNPSPSALLDLNFIVESLDVNPTIVTGIDVDNQPIRNYSAWVLDLSSSTYSPYTVPALGTLNVTPDEQFNVLVDVSAGTTSSFYDPTFGLTASSYVQIDLFTYYANDFRATFLPPTAIALVTLDETINSTGVPVAIPLLDGMNSVQPGSNATIVAWSWNVTPSIPNGGNASGEEVEAPFTEPAGTTYTVTLVVTNNFGLVGTDKVTYKF